MILILYSRPGCHLCDDMKAVVRRVIAADPGAEFREVDISGDAELERLYGIEIPVLLIDGRKAAKVRVSEGELRRLLSGRSA